MEGLGELGFWLAVGTVVSAMVVSGALKERDKERERQATLRALLEKEGRSATEILAYLREKDAAEAASARAKWVATWGGGMSGRQHVAMMGATMVGVLSCIGGVIAFGHLSRPRPRLPLPAFTPGATVPAVPAPAASPVSEFLPIGTMLGIWVVGLIVAGLILAWGSGRSGKQKNDPQPDV